MSFFGVTGGDADQRLMEKNPQEMEKTQPENQIPELEKTKATTKNPGEVKTWI